MAISSDTVPVVHAPAGAVPSSHSEAAAPPADSAPAPDPAEPAEPAPAEPAPQPPAVDPATAAMLQREGQIVAREQAIKAQEAEVERLRQLERGLREDPVAVATKNGATVDQWLMRFGQDGTQAQPENKPAVPPEVQQKLQELEEFKQAQETAAQQKASQESYQQLMSQINKTLDESDDLKVLKLAGLQDQVYNVVETHAVRTQQQFGQPQLLDTATAAKQVLDWAMPRLQAMIEGVAEIPQFKDVFDRVQAKRQQAPQPPAPGPTTPASITAAVASGTAPAAPEPTTHEERRAQAVQRALAMLQAGQTNE